MTQGTFQLRVLELVTGFYESSGYYASACQQECVGHFSKSDASGCCRNREDSCAGKNSAQGSGELLIGDGIGRDSVDCTTQSISDGHMMNCTDSIIESDPAHISYAVFCLKKQTHAKRRKH